MNPEPPPSPAVDEPFTSSAPQFARLFVREPGWKVALKVGSDRMFCYMMAPGQNYYHRLLDGEVYLSHGDERICLACASRRGLLSFEPRGLGDEIMNGLDLDGPHGSQFEVTALDDAPEPG
jgi:hypothetical protein